MSTPAPGTPSWVDLGSPDLEASKRFYSELFGWTADTSADPQAGGYTIFNKDGKAVAGAGPLFSEGQPTAWSTYIATDNADAVAARVEEAGGKVISPPFDVMQFGRMGVFTDPSGAFFSIWQAGEMPGAELFNAPGALCWNELMTRDPEGAKAFYASVFGWGVKDSPFGELTYTEWQVDGRTVAGMFPMVGPDAPPPEVPPHWVVYFAVDDCDATVAKTQELGGAVVLPPKDIPQGRFAMLTDPHGAAFSVIKMS